MARVEGVEYTPDAVEAAREEIIDLRNEALGQGAMHHAVLLSHVIAYLADYSEAMIMASKSHD